MTRNRTPLHELQERHCRRIKPWEYPDCETCGVEIYVDLHTHADYICHKCERQFSEAEIVAREAQSDSHNPALSD